MSRGINAAAILFCLAIAISMLAGLGFYQEAGLSVDSGMQDDVQQVNESIGGDQDTDNPNDDNLFGLIRSGIDTVTVLWTLITSTSTALQNVLGLPAAIADGIQLIARLMMGLLVVMLMLRFKFT